MKDCDFESDTLTLVVRFGNGEVSQRLIQKRVLNLMIGQTFITGDEAGIRKFLDTKSQPAETFAPVHYGVVVVDYQSKRVSSMQGYCSLTRKLPEYFGLMYSDAEEVVAEERQRYQGLISDGCLSLRSIAGSRNGHDKALGVVGESYDALCISMREQMRKTDSRVCVVIDWHPMRVVEYNDTLDGSLYLKADLADDGFVFSDLDEACWDSWFNSKQMEEGPKPNQVSFGR
ncbi:hypothetical protein ACFOY8_13545 [Thalassospira xianhensis]|uniref:Uncharacterized protein n=1 Tax=Thalassospira xianhensis MCCC 1A02616 TaxID=1177929 RepID=A0A367UKY6_9PROT|nr:hypothetical protein [Thalassospira xianhensis]RCK07792.1 hypothetical protein TH5_01740 [Thalassospira xianhensis MCCC 1A02616]